MSRLKFAKRRVIVVKNSERVDVVAKTLRKTEKNDVTQTKSSSWNLQERIRIWEGHDSFLGNVKFVSKAA